MCGNWIRITIAIVLFANLHANWQMSLEFDARFQQLREKPSAELHRAAFQIRKSFADSKGDRLAFFAQLESEENFKTSELHEMYFRYQGPFGAWKLKLGSFTLPYGLLSSFSTKGHLIESAEHFTLGMHADKGFMLSGYTEKFDYALSLTQGDGASIFSKIHSPKFATARLGIPLGETGEGNIGLSAAIGQTAEHSHFGFQSERKILGSDASFYFWQFLARAEFNIGKIDNQEAISAFWMLDYAINPRFELTLSGLTSSFKNHDAKHIVLATNYRLPWFTWRMASQQTIGGKNEITMQIYRIFTFNI